MPFPFGPVAVGDDWTPAATFTGFLPSQRLTLRVESNAVYMQLQLGLAGSWATEELVSPGWPSLTRPVLFSGIRFKNVVRGAPAIVSGTCLEQ